MRKFIGVVSLLVVVFLVAMTLQFVLAQEGSKPPSKEIEIKPGEATPAPSPTQAGEYQPNAESGQPQPFNNLIQGGGAPPSNIQQPTAAPTLLKKIQLRLLLVKMDRLHHHRLWQQQLRVQHRECPRLCHKNLPR